MMEVAPEESNVPFHLMPVAAFCGCFAFLATCRAAFIIYENMNYDKLSSRKQSPPAVTLESNVFVLLISMIVAAIAGYGKIVAKIQKVYAENERSLFNPYEILGVSEAEAQEKVAVTQAYRDLLQIHHPEKGGTQAAFMKVQYAFEALADDLGIQNYQKYGHPDGPLKVPSFELSIPSWLFFPDAPFKVQAWMIFTYLFCFSAALYLTINIIANKKKGEKKAKATVDSNTVSLDDLGYMGKVLHPKSTHHEVLLAIASAPENIDWATEMLDKVEETRKKALAEKEKEKNESKKERLAFDDLDDQGWADDDDDEDEDEDTKQAKLMAKKAEEEKKKQMEQLKKATGQVKEPLEGIDDGVLGQKWVMKTLKENGKWPPQDLSFLKDMKFDYNGKKVPALEHPGLERILCMTTGRIHSRMLNTHPELCKSCTGIIF